MADALLVLEDGTVYPGSPYGAVGETVGEAVFCTAMTGYQETLTDPSYHRQIVVMTAPHIGNTGVNDEDVESGRIWVAGFVVRDPARRVSSHRAERTLDDELRAYRVVGISGVDTRALTRHLRERGAMRAGIFSGDAAARPQGELLDVVRAAPSMAGADLAGEVTTDRPYVVPASGDKRFTVAAVDLGIKGMTPRLLAERGVEVHVLQATATIEDVLAVQPDGVFFSNGPGDPGATEGPITLLREVLDRRIPFFGICFGNQLLGRALGLETYKLRFGHRGVNQPVLDRATGRVGVTAHNHGFAVRTPGQRDGQPPPEGPFETAYGRAEVSHVCLNDAVVEGLACLDVPAFSVQYHPEAAAGPHDAGYLFDRFTDLMSSPRVDHGIAPPAASPSPVDHGIASPAASPSPVDHGIAPPAGVAGLHDHEEKVGGILARRRDHGTAPPAGVAGLLPRERAVPPDHEEEVGGILARRRDHGITPPAGVAGLLPRERAVPPDHEERVAGLHDHDEGGTR